MRIRARAHGVAQAVREGFRQYVTGNNLMLTWFWGGEYPPPAPEVVAVVRISIGYSPKIDRHSVLAVDWLDGLPDRH